MAESDPSVAKSDRAFDPQNGGVSEAEDSVLRCARAIDLLKPSSDVPAIGPPFADHSGIVHDASESAEPFYGEFNERFDVGATRGVRWIRSPDATPV